MATYPAPSLPSPSPSPPLPATTVSSINTLSGRINAATRKQHIELNRLIVKRIPLALPPNTSGLLLYGKGLVPFARLFIFFESEWDLVARKAQRRGDALSGIHSVQVQRWLSELRPQGLVRTERAQQDLRYLRLVAGNGIYDTANIDPQWAAKMRTLIRAKPHVLVAFAWVMYMAVFSGGRWIRQQLANAGPEFWMQKAEAVAAEQGSASALLDLPGFSFLSFAGNQDGENIKAAFKARLVEAETLLTAEEKHDVVEASKEVFTCCIRLVRRLDRAVMRQKIRSWASSVVPVVLVLCVMLALFLGGWHGGISNAHQWLLRFE